MLQPPPTAPAALAEEVAALRARAGLLVGPPAVLDGWASLAALEYARLALRIAAGLAEVQAALDAACAALEPP